MTLRTVENEQYEESRAIVYAEIMNPGAIILKHEENQTEFSHGNKKSRSRECWT